MVQRHIFLYVLHYVVKTDMDSQIQCEKQTKQTNKKVSWLYEHFELLITKTVQNTT